MQKILLATHNFHKAHEFRQALRDLPFEIIIPSELGLFEMPEETGKSFLDNARIKAEYFAKLTSLPIISDDSGLVIEALDGFPGIHSARFMEHASYRDKCQAIIDMLNGKEDRTAHFMCALVYLENGHIESFMGVCPGRILPSPKGEGGFGYDPIFQVEGYQESMAELPLEVKNSISHRGRAIALLRQYLQAK